MEIRFEKKETIVGTSFDNLPRGALFSHSGSKTILMKVDDGNYMDLEVGIIYRWQGAQMRIIERHGFLMVYE